MRVPYSWLCELSADLPGIDTIVERLTMSGIEVESVRAPDPRLVEGLVTARIVECGKHPNADRLTLCQVDDGTDVIPIVCGATNMTAGDRVVLARPGTVLPDGRKIQRSKLRGEESRGMLCAAEEIGLGQDGDGILILDAGVAEGQPAAKLLGIDDAVMELSVTPNRGDCLSMIGVAREVAAVCGLDLPPGPQGGGPAPQGAARVAVHVDDAESCPLYTGIEVRDVTVGPSPAWLAARLQACGLRPINNVVDVTNYVLWEHGQPLHAFDLDRLSGPEIHVARVGAKRMFLTLDDSERQLLADDLVICDGDGPIAIAGVMGGAASAVHHGTKNLFLESAVFAPARVRATSRRLGLISDSSYRFERGVDPGGVEVALLRAAALLVEVAGGQIEGGVCRGGQGLSPRAPIELRLNRIAVILGIEIDAARAESLLEGIGCHVKTLGDGGTLAVTPPSHRHDLDREIDLIEEVARLHGYENIPALAPRFPRTLPASRGPIATAGRLRDVLSARGLREVVTLAFCTPALNRRFPGVHASGARAVIVENPSRSDANELRRSLVPGLLAAREFNVRNGASRSDLFALARTYAAANPFDERSVVAGLLAGPRRTRSPRDEGAPEFWDVKGLVEHVFATLHGGEPAVWRALKDREDLHPRAAAAVLIGEQVVGYAGEVHPDALETLDLNGPIMIFEIDLGCLSGLAKGPRTFRLPPRFPASARDVSLLVADAVAAGTVIETARALAEPLLEGVSVFDEYRGPGLPEGRRALAFRLSYRAEDRTLTEEEVALTHQRVVDHLLSALDVAVRA